MSQNKASKPLYSDDSDPLANTQQVRIPLVLLETPCLEYITRRKKLDWEDFGVLLDPCRFSLKFLQVHKWRHPRVFSLKAKVYTRDHTLKKVFVGMKEPLENLKHLKFVNDRVNNFDNLNIILSTGFYSLRSFNNLHTLDLTFDYCRTFSDRDIYLLKRRIQYSLSSLKSLALDFSGCKKVTDSGLLALASGIIRHQIKLKQLCMNFTYCPDITDYGLKTFASRYFRYYSYLRNFKVDFYGCQETTNEGVIALIYNICKYLKHLTVLDLNFGQCQSITNETLIFMGSEVPEKLKNLRVLRICLYSCDELSDEGIKALAAGFSQQNSPKLEEFQVNFANCSKVSAQCELEVQNIMKFHTGLGI